MSNKPDFLKECMEGFGNVPLDDFNAAFCAVCHNRECARSNANTMLFDQRVSSWKERLFDRVPTAKPDDPAFGEIRNKEFKSVEPGNVKVPTFFSVDASPSMEKPTEKAPAPVEPSTLEANRKSQKDSKGPQKIQTSQELPSAPSIEMDNTAFQQGTVLRDASSPTKKEEATVLEPGQAFTFDDE